MKMAIRVVFTVAILKTKATLVEWPADTVPNVSRINAGANTTHFISNYDMLVYSTAWRCCMNPFKPALAVADWGHAAT